MNSDYIIDTQDDERLRESSSDALVEVKLTTLPDSISELTLEERLSQSAEQIRSIFGDIKITYQIIKCDYPKCGKQYSDLSNLFQHQCNTCKRIIDLCKSHQSTPSEHCIFCMDDSEYIKC